MSLFSGLTASVLAIRRIWGIAAVIMLIACAGLFMAQNLNLPAQTASEQPASWTPSDRPNSPIGDAKGIYPGRVTWIRDLRAATWDGKTGNWWDDPGINQDVLDRMMALSLRALAGGRNDAAAWDKMFRYHNKTHGRGDKGYAPGELIATKINLNNTSRIGDVDNDKDAPHPMIRTLLKQLVNTAKVPQKQIVIYDASRVIANRIYDPLQKGAIVNSDVYMHEAARGSNATVGAYKPNGKEIGSLGVHEHWNNAEDRKYSRNLSSRGKGIELFSVAPK